MRAKEIKGNLWLLTLLILTVLVSSCTSDDTSSVTINDYCYIKSATLGTVKRRVEERDRQGNLINTINTTFTGSNYAMTVNHRDNTIENRTPLPYGSQLSTVTANIIFDGSMLRYRVKGSNSGWTAYNSADSLDLTNPLELELTSNDSQSTRIYTFWVNVENEESDSLYWKQCESGVEQLAGMTDMKAFVLNDKLMVLGISGADTILAERSGLEAQGTWMKVSDEGCPSQWPSAADLQTLRQHNDTLYLSTDNGKIFYSLDAKVWKDTATTHTAALTLIEKTDKYFYAISGGKIWRHSTDANSEDEYKWHEDKLEPGAKTDSLPAYGIRALTMQQANGNIRLMMLGQRDKATEEDKGEYNHCFVWSKMWNEVETEKDAEWIHFPISPDNTIPCPRLEYLNLLPYDGKCIAFGGASKDGTRKALDAMYISQDYGITWRPSTELHMPIQLEGTDGCITSTVDKNNFIWIITNAQVWRGRLNRLGFAQQ